MDTFLFVFTSSVVVFVGWTLVFKRWWRSGAARSDTSGPLDLPSTLNQLTPSLLTRALQREGTINFRTKVRGFELTPLSGGVGHGEVALVRLAYRTRGWYEVPPPRSVVVKLMGGGKRSDVQHQTVGHLVWLLMKVELITSSIGSCLLGLRHRLWPRQVFACWPFPVAPAVICRLFQPLVVLNQPVSNVDGDSAVNLRGGAAGRPAGGALTAASAARQSYEIECSFYEHIAKHLRSGHVRLPELYFVQRDPVRQRYFAVLEDLTLKSMGSSDDGFSDENEAAVCLRTLASIHVSYWKNRSALLDAVSHGHIWPFGGYWLGRKEMQFADSRSADLASGPMPVDSWWTSSGWTCSNTGSSLVPSCIPSSRCSSTAPSTACSADPPGGAALVEPVVADCSAMPLALWLQSAYVPDHRTSSDDLCGRVEDVPVGHRPELTNAGGASGRRTNGLRAQLEPHLSQFAEAVGSVERERRLIALVHSRTGPQTLVHGDFKISNLFVDQPSSAPSQPAAGFPANGVDPGDLRNQDTPKIAADRPGDSLSSFCYPIDWQWVGVGSPAVDVAYFFATSVGWEKLEQDRSLEDRLLRLYYSWLVSNNTSEAKYPFALFYEHFKLNFVYFALFLVRSKFPFMTEDSFVKNRRNGTDGLHLRSVSHARWLIKRAAVFASELNDSY